jgi:GTP pyrophosphokinase
MNDNSLSFEALMEKIKKAEKNYDLDKIQAAFDVANNAHMGQTRKSGEPYISHPIAVSHILLELCMDTDTIVAALLHDVVEDTDIPLEALRRQFGNDVAALVDGVTKIRKIKLKAPKEQEGVSKIEMSDEEQRRAEGIRKILIAMSKDIRVMIIKLADRIHNMRTLSSFKPEKQRRIALETMTFYAPLAHRLGIAHIKDEMENTSLLYLDPYAYKEIEDNLKIHEKEGDSFIERISAKIAENLSYMTPTPVIEGRVKGIYSLHKKMYSTGKELKEVYDLYAFRVIVDTSADCYAVMGVIHDIFTPLSGRFKDYIASPKVNGYQSLHTIVLGREGQPFEVQIRTHEMHNTARFGVAAHWRYKLGAGGEAQNPHIQFERTNFDFIRQLLDQQQHSDDVEHLSEAIKNDLSSDEVYVFTPKGDVQNLPSGSTVVDFAYAIHTEVGNKMTEAKIHSKRVSFDYVLHTGDVVEIYTTDSPSYGPNRSWLDFASTVEAKSKIRHWLKHERRDENISSGRAYVESVIKREGIHTNHDALTAMAKRHNFNTIEDFYAAIAYGGVDTSTASLWIEDELGKKSKKPKLVRFYIIEIEMIVYNRRGALGEVSTAISNEGVSIRGNSSKTLDDGSANLKFELEITSVEQLDNLISSLKEIAGVINVERIGEWRESGSY